MGETARKACQIEIDILGEPIGKQDQYIAAVGGITCFQYGPLKKDIRYWPLGISEITRVRLEENLLLFFTGYTRKTSDLLKDQVERSEVGNLEMTNNLNDVKVIGFDVRYDLERGNMMRFADRLNDDWELKKARSSGMTNPEIDAWYEFGMNNGAAGGCLQGAGGGGFLKFYATNKEKLRSAMAEAGLREVRFGFDYEGTKVIES